MKCGAGKGGTVKQQNVKQQSVKLAGRRELCLDQVVEVARDRDAGIGAFQEQPVSLRIPAHLAHFFKVDDVI